MDRDVITVGKGITNKPWDRQKVWKRMTVPSYEEIVAMTHSFETEIESVLFALCYLTAGRISEIMPQKFLYKRKYQRVRDEAGNKRYKFIIKETKKVPHNYTGVRRRDFQDQIIDGLKVLVISIENRKNKSEPRKFCPVPVEKETELVKIIYQYINKFSYETPLFNRTIRWAESVINKVGMNAHFLRDIRATHLAQNYNFTEYHLIAFMGWTDGRPASRYVLRNWKKIVKNFNN